MTTTAVPITYPPLKKEPVPVQTAVERSLARPDAFSKPGTIGKSSAKVRVRTTSGKITGRKKKKDYRDVQFY
jgi:hypothetical protein